MQTHSSFANRFYRFLAALVFSLSWLALGGEKKLTPEGVAGLLPQVLDLHVKQKSMDTAFARRVLREYIDQLDPARTAILKSEAEALTELPDAEVAKISRQAMDGDLTWYNNVLKGYLEKQVARDTAFYAGLEKRSDEIKALAQDRLKTAKALPHGEKKAPGATPGAVPGKDKDADDPDDEDPDGIKWTERPLTQEEREKRMLRGAAALYWINKGYLKDEEAIKLAVQSMRQERDKWLNVKPEEDVARLFLRSFMLALDPHSDYLVADDEDEFINHMQRSFAGIGVQIRSCPLGAHVEDVIKGGPCDKSKRFAIGDQIVAVDTTSLAGMPINKIVKLIKGEKGTDVKVTLLKKDTQMTEVVNLRRDTIQLADLRVKGKLFDTPAGPVGLISVQNFYQGVHGDVRVRINELGAGKDKPLAGVVLDLRSNTGGFLDEAIGLAGLFIHAGPIVGERNGKEREAWQNDPDPGIFYSGPLAILTNQFSASASEIVTGTLKDYGRAVVVAHTQTYGKGTVQRVLPLSSLNLPGEIKVTTDQYFLAGGSSVQQKGVEPDVVIPGPKLLQEEGYLERATPNAIVWQQIPGKLDMGKPEVKVWTEWRKNTLPALQQKSKERVEANPELKAAFDTKTLREKAEKAAADRAAGVERDREKEKNEKDLQVEEAVAVVQDMIATWPGTPKKIGAK